MWYKVTLGNKTGHGGYIMSGQIIVEASDSNQAWTLGEAIKSRRESVLDVYQIEDREVLV